MTSAGALLIVALSLDWWGYPEAFDHPDSLTPEAQFAAEAIRDSASPIPRTDAYEFFDFRDALWLATGIAGFGLGLLVLIGARFVRAAAAIVAALAAVSTVWIALTIISPPDYAEVAVPDGVKPVDFGMDLPFDPRFGAYLALAAAATLTIAALWVVWTRKSPPADGGPPTAPPAPA